MSVSECKLVVDECLTALIDTLDGEPGHAGTMQAVETLRSVSAAVAVSLTGEGRCGLPEVFRLLASGLTQRLLAGSALSPSEVRALSTWLLLTRNYCRGELHAQATADVIDGLQELPWVPEVPARMRDLIAERLSAGYVAQDRAVAQAKGDPPREASGIGDGAAIPDGEYGDETDREHVDFAVISAVEALTADPNVFRYDAYDEAPAATNDAAFASGLSWPVTLGETASDNDRFVPAPVPAVAPSDAAGGPTEAVLWISPEELELAAQAVTTQLIPLTESLFALEDADGRGPLIDDLGYQTRLICSALEMLGLANFHRSGDIVVQELESLSDLPADRLHERLGALLGWQVALLGFLQDATDPTAHAFLIETLSEPSWARPLDAQRAEIMAAELGRIAIGRDPALLRDRREFAGSDDVLLNVAADVLPSVLDGMLSELPANARQLAQRLHALVGGGGRDDIDVARRVAHTLKGDANTVGIRGIANVTHALEDILAQLAKEPRKLDRTLGLLLEDAADCVEAMADHVLGRGAAPAESLEVLQRIVTAANALSDSDEPAANDRAAASAAASVDTDVIAEAAPATPRSDAATPTLQIPVALLDELLRLSSETIVVARQVEEQLRGIGVIRSELQQQGAAARELVAQLDDLVDLRGAALQSARLEHGREVDALELDQYNELHVVSRRLIETSGDTGAHLQALERSLGSVGDLSAQQDRIQLELQQAVVGTRSVPVQHQVPRFQRVVRQTARVVLKEAELEVIGGATLVDSDILDGMSEPLVHALRNAVDHGIEPSAQRVALGKPPIGRITLEVERRGSDILFRLADDGRGLDYTAIRARAISRGLLREDEPSGPIELNRIVLLPGFSTRDETTHVSGRGIGMDVVYRRVNELRGTMTLKSQPGVGTVLEMTLPASLVSAHVALARSSAGTVALVTNGIQQFLPIAPDTLERSSDGWWFTMEGERIAVVPLDALMGETSGAPGPDSSAVGILVQDETGVRQLVLTSAVDEMRSVIVKGFGPYVAPVPGVRGATILGTGGVAPVVDLRKLLSDMGWRRRLPDMLDAIAPPLTRRVVVADDSLSVRRALTQLMQDAGFEVVSARDGLEALALVNQQVPAAVLVDLEMPRMNGLELTAYLRNRAATAEVPIIMITSRTSDRHQQLALNAGVTQVMGKPYGDDELVALVRHHIAAAV